MKRKALAICLTVSIVIGMLENVSAADFSDDTVAVESTDVSEEEILDDEVQSEPNDEVVDSEEVDNGNLEDSEDEVEFEDSEYDDEPELEIEEDGDVGETEFGGETDTMSGNIEGTENSVSGICGDNMTWKMENNVLTITGSGEMYAGGPFGGPWGNYAEKITGSSPYGYDTVIISEGVTSLCDKAFVKYNAYCLGVKKITLPSTLKTIGKEAFWGNKLEDMPDFVLPSAVTSIGERAFANTGIKSLNLSNLSLTELSSGIVRDCKNLENIALPESIITIGSEAFKNCTAVKSIKLPSKVETIGESVFMNCSSLEHINIPGTVKKMLYHSELQTEEGVFTGATKLKTAGKGDTYNIDLQWGEGDILPGNAFTYADCVEEVTIPDGIIGLEEFSSGLFKNAKKLKKVKFPESMQNLNGEEFWGCSSLEEVNIPRATTELRRTFLDCSSLKKIEIPEKVTLLLDTFNGCSALEKVEIPKSVEKIWEHAFENCSALKEVIIPDTVKSIEMDTFKGCTLLNSAGPTVSNKAIKYGWTEQIPQYAFAGSEIQEVAFPETISSIDMYAFEDCTKLEQVILPHKLETIEYDLFKNCTSLKTVRIPDNVKYIRNSAFENCESLKSIYFHTDAPKIDDVDEEGKGGAFAGDTLKAYYPENNSTWNRKTFRDYGGKITWKPYVKGKPVDDAKERTITIEGGGRASVRFYLCDENGDALPEHVFKFYGHSTIVSKKDKDNESVTAKSQIDNSILDIIGSGDVMTDVDGGYTFYTPYYEYQPSGDNEYQIWYEVSWNDEKGEKHSETFTVNLQVEAMSYTETWTATLKPSVSATEGGKGAEYSSENESEISIEHKKDGSEDLILKLKLSKRTSADLKRKYDVVDSVGESTGIGLLNVSGSSDATEYNTYSTVIHNYDDQNEQHKEKVETYIKTLLFIDGQDKNSVLINSVIGDALGGILFDQFNVSDEGIKIKLSGKSSILEMKIAEGLVEKLKIGAVNDETTYTSSLEKSIEGTKKYSVSLKSEKSFALISGGFLSVIGVTGLKGFHNVNDEGITVTNDNAELSYYESRDESGDVECFGYDELMTKQRYILQNADEIIKKVNLTKQASGIHSPVNVSQISEVGKLLKTTDLEYTYKLVDELKNTASWEPSFDILEHKDFKLGAKAKLEYAHKWSTETYKGVIKNQIVLWESDSSNSIKRAREDVNSDKLETVLASVQKDVKNQFTSALDCVSGKVGDALSYGAAKVTTAASDVLNWTVSVIGKTIKSTKQSAESYSVYTLADDQMVEVFDAGNADQAVTAQTVGEAFVVKVTDENGNELSDISKTNMKITLKYSEDELKAAGGTMDNASDLAIYRYDDSTGAYIYIGGEINYKEQQLTADIDRTGEYILIVDGAAPNITNIDVTNRNGNPVIKATIFDLSGVDSVSMKIDGEEKVTAENFEKYYDKKTAEFSYKMEEKLTKGKHTVSFVAKDKKGKQTDQTDYSFNLSGLPEFTSISVPEYVLWDEEVNISAQAKSPDDEPLVVTATVIAKKKYPQYTEQKFKCELFEQDNVWSSSFASKVGFNEYDITFTAGNGKGDEITSSTYKCRINHGQDCEFVDGETTYKFNLLDNTITSIETSEEELVIPDTIYGKDVKYIKDKYGRYDTVNCITIPSSIEKISFGSRLSDGLKIKGYTNSSACYYAKKNNLEFIALGEVENQGYSEDAGNLTWTYREGILTISGTGNIEWDMYNDDPVKYFSKQVKEIDIEEGISGVTGSFSSKEYPGLKKVKIAKSVSTIEYNAFINYEDELTIYGYYDSAAYEYSNERGIKFEALAPVEGQIGDTLKWNYWKGMLTISGTGEIPSYDETKTIPWAFLANQIKVLMIEKGVTSIGERAFTNLNYVNELHLPDTLVSIGKYAFFNCVRLTSVIIPDSVSVIENHAIGYCEDWDEEITKMPSIIIRGTTDIVKKYAEDNGMTFMSPDEYWNIADSEVYWEKEVEYEEDEMTIPSYINVIFKEERLEEGEDYVITFENNSGIGVGRFIITGIGNYRGTITGEFEIIKGRKIIYIDNKNVNLNTSKQEQYYQIEAECYGGDIEYQSLTKGISVDKTGKVKILGNYSGTIKIKVYSVENEYYKGTECEVKITVGQNSTNPVTPTPIHIHQYGAWKVVKKSTALVAGYSQRTCKGCGRTEQKKLAKLAPTGSLNMTSIPLKVKQKTTALKVSRLASGDYVKAYTSNNKKIFTVTKKGRITAIKAGNAVLTVTLASGKQLKAKVKVQKGTVKTSKVTVAERSKVLKKGKSYQIKALVSPLTSQEKVTYVTSNKKVATVSKNGKVVAKKKGKVVITVKSGKKNAKVKITVK